MNDKPPIEESDDASADEPKGPLAGERLAAARREQQISIDEVAKELHLDEPKVRALERNDFDTLGAPVFAKGHLRKYAQLVGISMDEVVAEYESLNRTPDVPPVVGTVRRMPREISLGPWIAGIVLIAILGAVYWWFVLRPPAEIDTPAPETTMPAATGPSPAQDESAADVPAAATPSSARSSTGPAASTSAAREAAVEDGPEPDAVPAAVATSPDSTPTAGEGQSTLTLRYSGDCWTEITDAGGERLFFALGREGRTVNLVGEAPFSVVFGDADNVSVAVDGEPYAIPAANRSGRMARLTIIAR